MDDYPTSHWRELGRWVARERHLVNLDDTNEWAAKVGRSSRMVLGLERGERVGHKTLAAIAEALDCPVSYLYSVLELGEVSDQVRSGMGAYPRPDLRPATTPDPTTAYVSAPGEHAERGISDRELLEEIREMRRAVEELNRKLDADKGQP